MTATDLPAASGDPTIEVHALRGPWRAVIASAGDAITWEDYDGNGLEPEDAQILIVRGTALPDESGRLPGSYRSADKMIEFDLDDCDTHDEIEALWIQVQAMVAGLALAADRLEEGRG